MDASLDKYEQALEENLITLQNCQKEKQTSTCSKCQVFFDCKTRKNYVEAVYASMNKGNEGGFDF